MSEEKQQVEELIYGQKQKLILPSGYYVVIREQNGNDDDILSNKATAEDLTNIDTFLSSLIIETDLPFAVNKRISVSAASKMLLRDRYFIIFASRVHSMGNILRFKYEWPKPVGEVEYEEDLNEFLWDYTKPMPEPGDENYNEFRIKPYIQGKDAYRPQLLTLKSGSHKQLRYNLTNGESEKYLLKLSLAENTRNAELKARNLEMLFEDKWVKVQNFMYFSKREMAELHKHVLEVDAGFQGLTELENPQTKEVVLFPVIQVHDFFYPEEI